MRFLVLFFAILLSFNTVLAKPLKRNIPPLPPTAGPFPIDEEYQEEFVGFDKLEYKTYLKDQKLKAKLDKKREKLVTKKTKLEQKKELKIQNCERSQVFIDQLEASRVEVPEVNENL